MYSVVELCLSLVVVADYILCRTQTVNPSTLLFMHSMGWRVFKLFFLHLLLLSFLNLCLRGLFCLHVLAFL